jgi:hypothetical protein
MGSLTTCRQCGMSFNPSHHLTRYCGHRCRSEAQQDRHQAPATGLEIRQWEGHAIQRRHADGYVNATAMCQANGKKWNDYARLDRTHAYIAALARALGSAGNPADLIQVVSTGPNHLRGTWVHPRLAVDLARWCRPAFAVWMDGWFLEAAQQPQAMPQPVATRQVARTRRPVARAADGASDLHTLVAWLPRLSHRQEESPDPFRALVIGQIGLLLAQHHLQSPNAAELRGIVREHWRQLVEA